MTDRQTDRHRAMASTVLAQCRADKMVAVTGPVHGRLNAALHRPTFTISVHVDIASIPSKAVDGNKGTDALYGANNCFVSDFGDNPSWAVDLGSALAVVGVLFTNRAGGYGNVSLFRRPQNRCKNVGQIGKTFQTVIITLILCQ